VIRYLDGPAAACLGGLLLRRAPLYLRVTRSPEGKWDALDQLTDTPAPGEVLYAYRRQSQSGAYFLDWTEGGRRRGGCFVQATYVFVPEQPPDAVMRDTQQWRAWARTQAKRGKE
jgi:hypothetical protein